MAFRDEETYEVIEDLQNRIAELEAAAMEVINDSYMVSENKPGPYDCFGVNGIKLWKLRQAVLKEVSDDD